MVHTFLGGMGVTAWSLGANGEGCGSPGFLAAACGPSRCARPARPAIRAGIFYILGRTIHLHMPNLDR